MLLGYHGAANLKTKKIIYEKVKVCKASVTSQSQPITRSYLEELSNKRLVIEEFTNQKSTITLAIARDTLVGVTSQSQQYLQKLEQYLLLLENLVAHTLGLLPKSPELQLWVSDLKIRWSSALNSSSGMLGGSRFYRIDNLRFELGMSLSLYAAFLRERAFEILPTDLVQTATLFRKAAGVYNYLASELLPPLQPSLPKERPAEVTSYFSSVMSLICLADVQAVSAKKAEENGNSATLLSKLHCGVTMILDEATAVMNSKSGEWKDISSKLKEILSTCRVLHELRSIRYLAEGLEGKEQIGTAVGVLRCAIDRAKNAREPKDDSSSRLVFTQELKYLNEMLRKIERDNENVWFQKTPRPDMLPGLEGQSIVKAIPYEPPKCNKRLIFKIKV